jgi:comEA protein
MSTDAPFIARNLRDQPVELHLGGRVVVLPPHGEIGLSAADREAPLVRVLERRRALAVRPRTQKVNLNTATATQLESLPEIGAATAHAIVAYRDAHGPFARIDDLQRVRGIGARTVAALADHVALRR